MPVFESNKPQHQVSRRLFDISAEHKVHII